MTAWIFAKTEVRSFIASMGPESESRPSVHYSGRFTPTFVTTIGPDILS